MRSRRSRREMKHITGLPSPVRPQSRGVVWHRPAKMAIRGSAVGRGTGAGTMFFQTMDSESSKSEGKRWTDERGFGTIRSSVVLVGFDS
jgi:hypothetical protein